MCDDAADAERAADCSSSAASLLAFMEIFQARKPQPSIYVRCLLQGFVFQAFRVKQRSDLRPLIFRDLEELVLPADTLLLSLDDKDDRLQDEPAAAASDHDNDRAQVAMRMTAAVELVFDPCFDLFRALAMTRPGARRMLCHTVQAWDQLQLDLEDLDAELRLFTHERSAAPAPPGEELFAFPLSSWAFHLKLRQMEWVVQLGFELDVYHKEELAGMYW